MADNKATIGFLTVFPCCAALKGVCGGLEKSFLTSVIVEQEASRMRVEAFFPRMPVPAERSALEQTLRRTLLSRIGPDGEIMDLHFTPGETEDAFLLTLRAECEQEITTERKPAHDRTDDTG